MIVTTPILLGFVFNCCCGCVIYSDAFTTDKLSTDYTTSSGSWTVSGGELTTSSSNALLFANSETSAESGVVDVFFDAVDDDEARLYVNYKDANNHLLCTMAKVASVVVGGYSLKKELFSVVGGVSTQIGSVTTQNGAAYGTPLGMRVCWDGSYVSFAEAFSTNGFGMQVAYTPISDGTKVALGTGVVTSTVTFDDLSIERHYSTNTDCKRCSSCAKCTDKWPQRLQIDIVGCGDAGWNGTWITDSWDESGSVCYWQTFEYIPYPYYYTRFSVEFRDTSKKIRVNPGFIDYAGGIIYVTSPYACMDAEDFDMTSGLDPGNWDGMAVATLTPLLP